MFCPGRMSLVGSLCRVLSVVVDISHLHMNFRENIAVVLK